MVARWSVDVLDGAHPFDEIAGGRYERMLQVRPRHLTQRLHVDEGSGIPPSAETPAGWLQRSAHVGRSAGTIGHPRWYSKFRVLLRPSAYLG